MAALQRCRCTAASRYRLPALYIAWMARSANGRHYGVPTPQVDQNILVEQPTVFDDGSGRVCRLKKALYGLKQSPRLWERHVKQLMAPHGYDACRSDPCLLVRRKAGGEALTIIVVYVDDFLITGPEWQHGREHLAKLFPCKDLGQASTYLGMQLESDG